MSDTDDAIEVAIKRLLERDDLTVEDLSAIQALRSATKDRKKPWFANLRAFAVLPLAGVVSALGAFGGTYLQTRSELSQAIAQQDHESELSETEYRRAFVASMFDVDQRGENARRDEQRRRICLSARMGAFRLPDDIIEAHAAILGDPHLSARERPAASEHSEQDPDSQSVAQIPGVRDQDVEETDFIRMMDILEITFRCSSFPGTELLPDSFPSTTPVQINPAERGRSSIEHAIDRLTSNDTAERRQARRDLAAFGLGAVTPAVNALGTDTSSYRIQLGTTAALLQIIQENLEFREQIASLITPEALTILMNHAAGTDETMRLNATEFLAHLDHPETVRLAMETWPNHTDANGRFNLASLILDGAADIPPEMSGTVRARLQDMTQEAGPRTQRVLNAATGALPD